MNARHIARELALLSISQTWLNKREIKKSTVDELLEQVVRFLTSEVQEYLKKAGENIEKANDRLFESDLLDKDRYTIRNLLEEGIKETQKSIELMGSALEWALIATLSKNDEIKEFCLLLIRNFFNNQKEIDRIIEENLTDWTLDRLNSIDLNILRLSVGEMFYNFEVPLIVTIDEAVELAKKYGTIDSGKFVNGVLKKILPLARKKRGEQS